MFPTSWIICFDSWLKGLNDWLCCRSRWRACRFGWFSIFWINSRTLALCNCFTIECGSPGILKSMSSSILSRINSLSVLSVLISWYTSGSSCTASLRLSGCPDLSWVCSTPTFLFSSDGHVWTPITSCVISSFPDLSEEQSSSWKDFTLISWERDVLPLTTNTSCCYQIALIYHRLALGLVGLVGRILLVWQLLLVTVEQLLLLIVDQL